jgi:hypothetical protein
LPLRCPNQGLFPAVIILVGSIIPKLYSGVLNK